MTDPTLPPGHSPIWDRPLVLHNGPSTTTISVVLQTIATCIFAAMLILLYLNLKQQGAIVDAVRINSKQIESLQSDRYRSIHDGNQP